MMEKRKARNIYSKVQSFCHNSHPFHDETRLNESIRNTTNETYVGLFCHNIEAACNLPRGVAAKRSNQQNDSFGQCTLPFFSSPLQPPFLFSFFIAAWLCCFHCARFSLGRSQGRHVAIVRDVDAIATYEYPRLGIIVCSADSDRRTEATRQPYNDAGKSNIRVVHVPSLLCIMNPISRISATDRNLWSVSTCNSASSASFSSANSDELFAGSVASPTRHVKNLIFLSSMRSNRRVGQPGNPRPRIIPRRIQERNGIRYSVSRGDVTSRRRSNFPLLSRMSARDRISRNVRSRFGLC